MSTRDEQELVDRDPIVMALRQLCVDANRKLMEVSA